MCWKGGRVVRRDHLVCAGSTFAPRVAPNAEAWGHVRGVPTPPHTLQPPRLQLGRCKVRGFPALGRSARSPRCGQARGATERARKRLCRSSPIRAPLVSPPRDRALRLPSGLRSSARAPSPHGSAFGSGFIVGSWGATHGCVLPSCSSRATAQRACRVGGRAGCPPSHPWMLGRGGIVVAGRAADSRPMGVRQPRDPRRTPPHPSQPLSSLGAVFRYVAVARLRCGGCSLFRAAACSARACVCPTRNSSGAARQRGPLRG